MLDSFSRLCAEMFSSQVFLTLLGVIVGGLLGLFGVRQASAAQFKIQEREWGKRASERDEERRNRESKEKEEQDRRELAAVRRARSGSSWKFNSSSECCESGGNVVGLESAYQAFAKA